MFKRILDAADYISKNANTKANVAVVLGTNFDTYAEHLEVISELDYRDIPGFPRSEHMEHKGKLIFARSGKNVVAVMAGRYHCYEGYTPAETVIPLRALSILGVEKILLTNAAGGINSDFKRGDLMAITDHINMTGLNALTGENIHQLGKRYPDMTYGYDPELTKTLIDTAYELGINMKTGVYGYMTGPSYETPAEIRALKVLGADAVGMSTVHEAVAANHAGVKIAAFSCISNLAAGISSNILTGEEVEETLNSVKEHIFALLDSFTAKI